MIRFGWLLGALALGGCGSDKTSEGDDTSAVETCTVEIKDTFPSDGETAFYYRGTIEIDFSDVDSGGAVTLTDGSGAEVAGTSSFSDDGKTLYFTPSSPLSPSTNYGLAIDYCGGNPSISFTTSELGGTASDLTGKAYSIDLSSANFIEPAGIGSVLGDLLTQNILVGVTAADSSSLTMIGAISTEGTTEQDMCTPSIDFPVADFSENPFFSIGPQDTTITVAGYSATIGDLEISGAFAPDGSYFGGGVLGGVIDTRALATIPDLADLAGCDGTDDTCLCTFIAGTGFATCSACPDGTGDYCLTLLADQIVATEISGSLVPLTEDDVAANASCAE